MCRAVVFVIFVYELTVGRHVTVPRSKAIKILADGSAYLSLACCVSFWILAAQYFIWGFSLGGLTGFQMFKTMGVAVLLATVALVLRSKLWKFALPFALLMFFFTMYTMGS
jgi:hypothetical protein